MTEHIHLCILSGQALPNLLPLCRYRPQRVALAVSSTMSHSIAGMTQTLLKTGLIAQQKDVISLPDMPEHDYAAMLAWAKLNIGLLLQVLPEHHLTLNATGGTKLMSQALSAACQSYPERTSVLYCDTAHDSIEWLAPTVRCEPLPSDLLDCATILKANGIERESAASDDEQWREQVRQRAAMTRWLGQHAAGILGSFIKALNQALHETREDQLPLTVSFAKPAGSSAWRQALRMLAEHRLLELAEPLTATTAPCIRIVDAQALRYLNGIWLEEYLWLCMQEAGMADVHCSLHISDGLDDDDQAKLNELDLALVHRNRMLVVECKTANLLKKGAYNQMLDKLESVGKRSGGLLAQCWLVAARWPHHSAGQQNRLRLLAKSRNITLIEPSHLADLTQRIQVWKSNLQLPLNSMGQS